MTVTDSHLRELKAALRDTLSENDAIVDHAEAGREEGGPDIQVDAKHIQGFRANLTKARDLRDQIEALEGQKEMQDWASASTEQPEIIAESKEATLPSSVGQGFVDSDEFKYLNGGTNGLTMHIPYSVKGDLGGMWQRKDVYTTLPSGTPAQFGTPQRDAIVERAHRAARVRDLFNVQQTSTNLVEYFRVTGFTNNSATTSERSGTPETFTAYPQSTLTIVGAQAPVRNIGHYEVAHRNVLADEPAMRGIVDNELLYGLRLTEDDQILNGDGTGTNLTGITATSGISTQALGSDTRIDAIRKAITKIALAYYEATGMVVHPSDLEQIELEKDGDNRHMLVASIAVGMEARIWRLPVVETAAITEGTALIGSFGIGATLYDRMEGSIRISENHSDFFVRNAIAILAEERIALAVKRPESFCTVTSI
jgi:HK97 family phage major capsid protein